MWTVETSVRLSKTVVSRGAKPQRSTTISTRKPTNVQPEADDFDALLARFEAETAAAERRQGVVEVTPEQIEVVKNGPSPKLTGTKKETTKVGTKKSAPLAKAAVAEPKLPVVRDTINLAGVSVPVDVTLTDRPLSVLEGIVEKGLAAVFSAGVALIEISARKLYIEAGYADWPTYVRERWAMGKSRSHQLMNAAKTIAAAEAMGVPAAQLPKNEAAARELESVVKAGDPETVQKVADEATAGGTKQMTAQSAADAKAKITGATPKITSGASKSRKAQPPTGIKPQPKADTALGKVTPENGKTLIDQFCNHLRAGTFMRNDATKLGTVERMRYLRGMIDAWLAGGSNVTLRPAANGNADATKAITAEQEGVKAEVLDAREQQKGESASEYALRVMANPDGVRPEVVEWAGKMVKVPASKADADKAKAVNAKADAIDAENKAKVNGPKGAKEVAAVQTTLNANADRPLTGTQQRRLAEAKAKAEVEAANAALAEAAEAHAATVAKAPVAKARSHKAKAA